MPAPTRAVKTAKAAPIWIHPTRRIDPTSPRIAVSSPGPAGRIDIVRAHLFAREGVRTVPVSHHHVGNYHPEHCAADRAGNAFGPVLPPDRVRQTGVDDHRRPRVQWVVAR